jgi:hypothetical protein
VPSQPVEGGAAEHRGCAENDRRAGCGRAGRRGARSRRSSRHRT